MYEIYKDVFQKKLHHLTSLLISHASTGRFSPNFQKRCLNDKQIATDLLLAKYYGQKAPEISPQIGCMTNNYKKNITHQDKRMDLRYIS